MSDLQELEALTAKAIWDGVSARTLEGERVTLAFVELEPGAHVPEHRHENEQVGVLIQGSLRFRIGDETRELGPGGTWRILRDTPHEVWTGDDGAFAVEAFAPARADWAGLEDSPVQPPRWPG
jgi:quercetin dioxygenase-like cupin family protein